MRALMKRRHPCPCCGHLTLDEPVGSWLICPVCGWEDDLTQLRWPDEAGGANKVSLREAQENYRAFGFSKLARRERVREPASGEPMEDGWRPIDLAADSFESPGVQEVPWPEDRTVLYWWRPTFWRRPPAE